MKKKVLKMLCVTLAACTLFATPVFADDYQLYCTRLKDTGNEIYYMRKPDMTDSSYEDEEYIGPVKFSSMYRLYNPNSGEHFYTANVGEKSYLVKVGWKDEGVCWYAPEKSNLPVYRLYNPNAGDHHYTTNAGERNYLIKVGWKDEGIGWYGIKNDGHANIVYRQYNPNAKTGTHNYTLDTNERDALIKAGWKDEGEAFEEMLASINLVYGNPSQKSENHNNKTNTNVISNDKNDSQGQKSENDSTRTNTKDISNDPNENTTKNSNNDSSSGYGTLTGVCIGYKSPDVGSYVLLVPKDKSAYNYDYAFCGMIIPSSDSEKYHIYSARVNAVGNYTINHVAAGEYKMIYYSNYYNVAKMISINGFPEDQQKLRQETLYNEFSPYINSESAKHIAWIYNASNTHDVVIFPNEVTSQDG